MRARTGLGLAVMTVLFGATASSWAATEAQPQQRTNAPATPGAQPGTAEKEGVIDPKADQALRRMSDYLASLKRFRFDSTTVDEKVTNEGQKVQEIQQSTITVKRPGSLRVDRVGPRGHAQLIYDGNQIAIANKDKHVYGTVNAPPNLDDAIEEARSRLHVDAPGGDLIGSNAYDSLTDGLVEGHYVGLEPIDGVMAHHLFVTKKNTDWQIWIKDGPDAVPLRFVVTSKDMPSQPQFTSEMHNWQANPSVAANAFTFTPPTGARKIDLTERKASR